AQKAIRYEVTAGSLTLTNVSFAAGKHYFQANPGGTLDMAQVQFSSGASTPRIAASGVDAVVKIGSELSVFTPNNIRNRPVFFIKNGGEIAFTDNFNVENYIQSGTSSLILEMLKGKSTGLANNLGRINIGYGKTVSLGKISIELPATGKGPLTLSKTGLGDLYINGVDIIDYDRKSFNKVLSQAFAVYSTSPSNHSGNLLSFALRNGLIDKKNASNTLEVLNEAIACNIIKTAYNLTLIDDAREIVFDGEFDCDSEFVVNKLRDATLLTRQNQTDLATIVGQKPYLSEHQVARAFDRLQQHDYIAARLSGELALANGSTLLTLGNFVGSDNIGFSMKPGSYLIATSDVMLNGSSEIVRATILSTSGNVYLRGNLMEHRFIGAQIDPLSHVILYENGRIASSGSVFDSDVEISPNAIFLSGTDGRGSLATKAQGIAAVNSFTNLITGDFTLRDNSKLALLVKSDGSSEGVDVNGSLIIGDGVKALLLPADGCFSKKIKTAILVKAASVTGSFDGAISSSDLLKVQLVKNDISGGGTQYSINFQRMDLTEIAALRDVVPAKMLIAMDNLLDRAADSPALYSKLAKLKLLSSFDVLGVIQGVQPSQLKALAMSQENNAVNVRNTLSIRFQRELDAMHCASSATPSGKCDVKAKPVHVWATGFGDNMYQGQVSDYGYGFQNNMGGFSAGVDYHFADVLYAGALGAYTSSDIDWLNGYGSGDITTGYAGVYMSAISKMYWGTIAVLGGWSDYSSDRNFFLQNNRLNFSNSHNGSQILSHADTGINLGFKGFTIRPFDSFDYISQTENSFHEKGNGTFNLEIDDQTSIMIRNELGINFAGCFCIKGMQWTVSPKISWVREVRVKGKTINAE
ncbi:MAG: autotransporter outer membrane beta-barrel domain-containing protein, partial [Chlamydiae bacterium]|nr:autotransporter outer membrane beta-barrel domain-containing protein [Chlamydiota bacterium]